MKIGDLARWAQCPTVTIRYYEKIGLMGGEQRDKNNYRIYGEEDAERLRFIMHCRNHGISIPAIRGLLALRDGATQGGQEAVQIIQAHVDSLKERRRSLDLLITSLSSLLALDKEDEAHGREIIDMLGRPCPHCPDYGQKADTPEDQRSVCLAHPSIRKSRSVF